MRAIFDVTDDAGPTAAFVLSAPKLTPFQSVGELHLFGEDFHNLRIDAAVAIVLLVAIDERSQTGNSHFDVFSFE